MRCSGHISITDEALARVAARCGKTPTELYCRPSVLGSNVLESHSPYRGRDYRDALCLVLATRSLFTSDLVAAVDSNLPSHFMDSQQRRHFMRGSMDSVQDAYVNGVRFIRERTTAFVHAAIMTIERSEDFLHSPATRQHLDQVLRPNHIPVDTMGYPRPSVLPPMQLPKSAHRAGALYFDCRPLGDALHALQDSFSPGHVERRARKVIFIHEYAKQDHTEHDHQDVYSGTSPHSNERAAAVSATAALVELVLRSAVKGESGLPRWPAFEREWLAAEALSTARPTPLPPMSRRGSGGSRAWSELN